MYSFEWDLSGCVFRLSESRDAGLPRELRPVFSNELDLLDTKSMWSYPKSTHPLMWAIGRRYFHQGFPIAETRGGGFFEQPTIESLDERFYGLRLSPMPSELAVDASARLLEGLAQRALEFIVTTYEKCRRSVDLAVVAFSGGKDSLVTLDLVQRALRPDQYVVVFSDTGMEVPPVYSAILEAKQRWPQVRFVTSKSHMTPSESWALFGPPSRIMRWCCSVHKTAPTQLYMRSLLSSKSARVLVFDGVRRHESRSRGGYAALTPGGKHATQINASPIISWSSAEVFLYMFQRGLPIHEGYRSGMIRTGCAVCPLASHWWDYVVSKLYPLSIEPFLKQLMEYASSKGVPPSEVRHFIRDSGWKGRAGGRDLGQGGNRVTYAEATKDELSFSLRSDAPTWTEWIKVLGTVVTSSDGSGFLAVDGATYPLSIRETGTGLLITVRNLPRGNQSLRSQLLAIARKGAYCVGCRSCEVECPTGALAFNGSVKVDGESCIHCGNCLSTAEKGCWAAKSLAVSLGGARVKGLNRYQHFGMKTEWLDGFLRGPEEWLESNNLGNRQMDAMRVWLREAELLSASKITPLGRELQRYGASDPLTWLVIWNNIARNSAVVQWYLTLPWEAVYEKKRMVEMLGSERARSTRENAVTALVYLLRYTPLGADLGLGIPGSEGRSSALYKRGSVALPLRVLLYSLYRLAEAENRYHMSVSYLVDGASEGPVAVFGLKREKLVADLNGLAAMYPDMITVQLVRDLDNVYLKDGITAIDALRMQWMRV